YLAQQPGGAEPRSLARRETSPGTAPRACIFSASTIATTHRRRTESRCSTIQVPNGKRQSGQDSHRRVRVVDTVHRPRSVLADARARDNGIALNEQATDDRAVRKRHLGAATAVPVNY